jgi:alpha-1,2-mannosyltransferase
LRVGILHDSLNYAGGAERVCLSTIDAAMALGHHVTLGTIDVTNWARMSSLLRTNVRPLEEIHLLPSNSAFFRIYSSTLMSRVLSKLVTRCDLCICTNHDVFPLSIDIGYMHYLPLCAIPYSGQGKEYSAKWRIYSYPIQIVQRRLLNKLRVKKLLTNSTFSRRMLGKIGLEAEVIHPAVDVEGFTVREEKPRKKRVVSIGRLSPEKNFELVLEVAEQTPEVSFIIIGGFAGAISRIYLTKLRKMIEARNLTNVHIFANLPHEDVISILHRSKLLLHTTRNEHFGIAVVESMAAGLVPVIHRSGGQWEDILSQTNGRYGFSFSDAQEATETVKSIIHDDELLSAIRQRNKDWVRNFSSNQFKTRMQEVINWMI